MGAGWPPLPWLVEGAMVARPKFSHLNVMPCTLPSQLLKRRSAALLCVGQVGGPADNRVACHGLGQGWAWHAALLSSGGTICRARAQHYGSWGRPLEPVNKMAPMCLWLLL